MTGHGEVPQSNRTIDAHVVALPMPIRRGSQPRPLKTEVRPVRLSRKRNGLRARAEAAPTWNKPDFRRSVAGWRAAQLGFVGCVRLEPFKASVSVPRSDSRTCS